MTCHFCIFLNIMLVSKHQLLHLSTWQYAPVLRIDNLTKFILDMIAINLSFRNHKEQIISCSTHSHVDDILVIYMTAGIAASWWIKHNEHNIALISLEAMHRTTGNRAIWLVNWSAFNHLLDSISLCTIWTNHTYAILRRRMVLEDLSCYISNHIVGEYSRIQMQRTLAHSTQLKELRELPNLKREEINCVYIHAITMKLFLRSTLHERFNHAIISKLTHYITNHRN